MAHEFPLHASFVYEVHHSYRDFSTTCLEGEPLWGVISCGLLAHRVAGIDSLWIGNIMLES